VSPSIFSIVPAAPLMSPLPLSVPVIWMRSRSEKSAGPCLVLKA